MSKDRFLVLKKINGMFTQSSNRSYNQMVVSVQSNLTILFLHHSQVAPFFLNKKMIKISVLFCSYKDNLA